MSENNIIKDFLERNSDTEVHQLIDEYVDNLHQSLYAMTAMEAKRECISGFNRMMRKDFIVNVDVSVEIGDICYIDFGQAYINEAGFQHFGLVVAMFNHKAFVIPMSSNQRTICKAYNFPGVISPRIHLYYIGQIPGMSKHSVLFLNDGKFINTSRIIDVKAHIEPSSKMFQEIKSVIKQVF